MKKIVFIDLETTGLNPDIHEIIECALIFEDGGTYHKYIRPNRIEYADPVALKINGFHERSKEWKDSISQEELAFALVGLLHNRIIIGHNPTFDMSFIKELIHLHGEQFTCHNRVIDTMTLAYEHLYHIGLKRLSLDSIRAFFGWNGEGSHTALYDTKTVKRLYYKLMRATIFDRFMWKYKFKYKKLSF